MVRLGDLEACPAVISRLVEAIIETLENFVPARGAISVQDFLRVDWWEIASQARVQRMSQDAGFAWLGGYYEGLKSTFLALLHCMQFYFNSPYVVLAFHFLRRCFHRCLSFDFFIDEPLVSAGGAMLTIWLERIVSNSSAFFPLVFAFLFQVNPLFVCAAYMVYIAKLSLERCFDHFIRKARLNILKKNHSAEECHPTLQESQPESFEQFVNICNKSGNNSTFTDVVLLGSDMGILFTAAVLSKSGFRCIVLEPHGSQPTKAHSKQPEMPVAYLEDLTLGNPSMSQALFDKVSTGSARILIQPIGDSSTNFAHTVVRLGHDSDDYMILRAGEHSLVEDIFEASASSLPSDFSKLLKAETKNQVPSPLSAVFRLFSFVYASAQNLLSMQIMLKLGSHGGIWKFFTDTILRSKVTGEKSKVATVLKESGFFLSVRDFLSKYLNCNEPSSALIKKAYSFLSGIAVTVGANESLSPDLMACVLIPYALEHTKHGLYFPRGGFKDLAERLYLEIYRAGGHVVKGAIIDSLIFDEHNLDLVQGVKLKFQGDSKRTFDIITSSGLMSGLGYLHTHIFLRSMLSSSVHCKRKVTTAKSLVNMHEARPKIYVVYWIQDASRSDIHPYNYFECPVHEKEQQYQSASNTHDDTTGIIVKSFVKVWSPTAKDASWKEESNVHRDVHIVIVELEAGDELMDEVACPVQSDHDLVSSVSDHSFVVYVPKGQSLDLASTKIEVNDEQRAEVIDHATKKLYGLYPQLADGHRVLDRELVTGHVGGRRLSSTCQKFVNSDVDENILQSACDGFKNVHVCGSDVAFSGFSGDMQGGCVAIKSILGYTQQDILGKRNKMNALYV